VSGDVVVVGAGVSGLTSAVCLAEAGLGVQVWAGEGPGATTSASAGALWGPYLVGPVGRVRVWSTYTLEVLRRLVEVEGTGVRVASGIEASRAPARTPRWAQRLDGYRRCGQGDLPAGFSAGWRFTAPLVDMTRYLPYLQARLASAGAGVQVRHVRSLAEAAAVARVVVNCAGSGARALVPDPGLTAVRGQLVVVRNPGLVEFFTEDTGRSPDLLYIYPHGDTVVLGGTAQPGRWDREPDPRTADAIVARCARVEPRLAGATVLGHRVGLRPTRDTVRVQTERTDSGHVVHNYGHGGAGLTLSWGCAHDVTTRVLNLT
jgi:D-amino-acid oxidase